MDFTIDTAPPAAPGSLPRMGRLAAVDDRDRRFSMSAPRTTKVYRSWLAPGGIWDQGNTPQCVSYAANKFLTAHRIVNKLPMSLADFYKECQKNDEWPGEDYDGTSVRAAFKVLKRLGYVNTYTWASEPEQVIRHILEIGPVVIGVDWTMNMFKADSKGYIWPTGNIVGGHAVILVVARRTRENPDGTRGALRILNSWGAGWAQKGRAWITEDTLGKLMKGLSRWPGEAATADEIKIIR